MSEFNSSISKIFDSFVIHRKACNKWNDSSYGMNLILFDKYCQENHSNANTLTQRMVDSWCKKRENESNNSCISRIYVIVTLVKYLQERNLTSVQIPVIPVAEKRLYIPHFFTQEELRKFFEACDNYKPFNFRTSVHLNIKYTLPVLFRLLYSSGMRTNEARTLRRSDVDFETGVVNIENTKGYEDYYIVLHDTMTDIMKTYDQVINELYPDRVYFFPNGRTGYRSRSWVAHHFKVMWNQVSKAKAFPYELRHNYAIENINRLIDTGMSFHDNMIYISKSMGHTSVDITIRHYYHLAPSLSEVLQEYTEVGFNELIPEVDYEKS